MKIQLLFVPVLLIGLSSVLVSAWANEQPTHTQVRFAHAVPDCPSFDVYVNGTKVLALKFREVSDYKILAGNQIHVDVKLGHTHLSLLSFDVQLRGTPITIAAVNRLVKINYAVFKDEFQDLNLTNSQSGLRAVHLSPDAPAVDVIARTRPQSHSERPVEIPLFTNLEFLHASEYKKVPSGCYDVLIRPAGGDSKSAVFEQHNVCLEERKVYSAFAEGLLHTFLKDKKLGLTLTIDYVFPQQQPQPQPQQPQPQQPQPQQPQQLQQPQKPQQSPQQEHQQHHQQQQQQQQQRQQPPQHHQQQHQQQQHYHYQN